MKIAAAILTGLMLTTLAGCEIRGPSVRIKPIVIDVEGGGGSHCPPGQAKKGNC